MKYLLRLLLPLFYFNYTYSQTLLYQTNNGVLLNKVNSGIYLNSNNDNFYLDLNDNILPIRDQNQVEIKGYQVTVDNSIYIIDQGKIFKITNSTGLLEYDISPLNVQYLTKFGNDLIALASTNNGSQKKLINLNTGYSSSEFPYSVSYPYFIEFNNLLFIQFYSGTANHDDVLWKFDGSNLSLVTEDFDFIHSGNVNYPLQKLDNHLIGVKKNGELAAFNGINITSLNYNANNKDITFRFDRSIVFDNSLYILARLESDIIIIDENLNISYYNPQISSNLYSIKNINGILYLLNLDSPGTISTLDVNTIPFIENVVITDDFLYSNNFELLNNKIAYIHSSGNLKIEGLVGDQSCFDTSEGNGSALIQFENDGKLYLSFGPWAENSGLFRYPEDSGNGLCQDDCSHPDIPALQAFYDATNGDQWKNTVAGNKPWFEDCDPCGLHDGTPWYGITCNGNHRVSALGLNFNNLVGTIPPSIDGLNEVNWLVLYDNPGLTGIIPNTICNIPHLQFFSLLRNNHTGSIPPCMANMASLVEVNFASNDFTGTIPAFGTNNPNLVNLLLANNQLSGSLPTSLINIPNPSTITFNNNNLSGCYPPQLADLCDHNMGTITGLNNSKVSDGNSFAAPWEDFCSSGAGTCTSSVKDNQEIDFSIVPNPSDNFTKIIGTDIDKVQLYDIYGKLVRESVKSEIYIGDFSSGMYLVKVESNSQFGFKYFVKI